MHDTSIKNGKLFFETYINSAPAGKILEIGSWGDSDDFLLRSLKPSHMEYVGVDIQLANNVDVTWDTKKLPFDDNSFDFVVSTSCFEHDELFWITYTEVLRVLKPHGVFYVNAPSNGVYHAYPVDCWRFYPDAARALVKWGKRNNYANNAVLEHYTHNPSDHKWADYVAVFIKDVMYKNKYPHRMLTQVQDDCTNPYQLPADEPYKFMNKIIQNFFTALSTKDTEALKALYDDNVVWWEWGENVYLGKDNVIETNERLFKTSEHLNILVHTHNAVSETHTMTELVMLLDKQMVSMIYVIKLDNEKINSIQIYRGF